jgi:transposase-like protein
MGRSTDKETGLSEQRKYRSWTAQQKIEIVLAGLRGDRSVKDVCREHEISDTLFYTWRDKLLEGGREALAGKEERSGERELRRKIRELERALGRKAYELEIAGEAAHGRFAHPEGCKWRHDRAVAVGSSAMHRPFGGRWEA